MKFIASILLLALCGCSQPVKQVRQAVRPQQVGFSATRNDINELKKDIADLKKLVNERFDRLEKR